MRAGATSTTKDLRGNLPEDAMPEPVTRKYTAYRSRDIDSGAPSLSPAA